MVSVGVSSPCERPRTKLALSLSSPCLSRVFPPSANTIRAGHGSGWPLLEKEPASLDSLTPSVLGSQMPEKTRKDLKRVIYKQRLYEG